MCVYSVFIVRYKECLLLKNENYVERKKMRLLYFILGINENTQKKIYYDKERILITDLYISAIEWQAFRILRLN
jgi:hypothetical protein